MPRGLWLFAAVLAWSLLVTGCTGAKPAPAGSAAPNILFQDDFSNPKSGWDHQTSSEATTDYDNGQYLIAVQQPSVDVWAQPGLDLPNVALQVQAQYADGPVNNEFGVICRYQRS